MDPQASQNRPATIRPRLLSILCYLTIFASSYMLVSSLSALANIDQTIDLLSQSLDKASAVFDKSLAADPATAENLDEALAQIAASITRSNMRDHHVFNLISNLLTLIGASLMLRLRKRGFHLYLLGTLIAFVAPLLVFGSDSLLGFAFSFSTALFGGLFVILYSLKIKYMH